MFYYNKAKSMLGKGTDAEIKKLAEILGDLKKNGVLAGSISILSSAQRERSCVGGAGRDGCLIRPQAHAGGIGRYEEPLWKHRADLRRGRHDDVHLDHAARPGAVPAFP